MEEKRKRISAAGHHVGLAECICCAGILTSAEQKHRKSQNCTVAAIQFNRRMD